MRLKFLLPLLFGAVFPGIVLANGGNIRLAEGKYLVNISSAPVTPVAGQKTSMLIAFADVATNAPLTQPITAWIEIRKKLSQENVFPSTEYPVKGGILEFAFTYPNPGLYELFVRFEKSDEPGKIYESEDFLMDVQPPKRNANPMNTFLLAGLAGCAGFFLGFILGQRHTKERTKQGA